MTQFSLPITDSQKQSQVRRWLLLGVIALGVAGIFAGFLGRTLSPFFYTALVIHVDLSVLVWFLTMACMFFALASNKGNKLIEDASFLCFASGAFAIALCAFVKGDAYMSNYIPVIHHPLFFFGLSLLLCGVLGSAFNLIIGFHFRRDDVQRFGVMIAAWIMLIAILCFILSVRSLPADMTGQVYYEYAFWGGGHVLQFVHTQLMMVAWLWLASASAIRLRITTQMLVALYAIGLLAALFAPFIYLPADTLHNVHSGAFTLLMRHANGFAPLVLVVMLVLGLLTPTSARTKLPRIVLTMSMLLFLAGGFLGYLIDGSNVTVPAHYHGSIVGVTLAFMGVAYLLLPQLGYRDVSHSWLARIQPVIYGGGQLCWMTGMAILGAHGVPRKTPGSADTVGAVAGFLKHGGDGLALIGGLLFVFIVLRAVCKTKE